MKLVACMRCKLKMFYVRCWLYITKYVYIKSTTVYVPSSELVLSQTLSRQRVCPSPQNRGGGGAHLTQSQFRRLEKKHTRHLPEKEASLLKPLLEGLRTHFLLALDTCPDISRDLSCSTGIPSTSPDLSAVFIGGSNADKLANAAASLGIIAETVTTSGWILSTTAVTAILPEVEALCITLPADSPCSHH
jgi:hypothetical protein